LSFQRNGKLLQEWDPRFGFGRIWNYDGTMKQEWLRPHGNLSLKYQTSLFLQYRWQRERFAGKQFNGVHDWDVELSTRPTSRIGGSLTVDGGRIVRRSFSHPMLGRSLDVYMSLTLKPTQRVQIVPSYSWSRMRTPNGNRTVYDGYIFRTRMTCQ